MRADQERVRELLTDTVTLLCKNGLHFGARLRIEGVLGITIDDSDVFIVHINESLSTSSNEGGGEDVTNSSPHPLLPSTDGGVLQSYRPPFRSRKRLINQTAVSPSSLIVRKSLEAESQIETCNAKNTDGLPSVPGNSHSQPIVKLENLCEDTDRVDVIDLDNDDEPALSGEAYNSITSISQLSKSRSGLERGSNLTKVVDSKSKKMNHSNHRFKTPIFRSSTETGLEMDCRSVMNNGTNSNRSSFHSNTVGGVNSSSVDITSVSTKQEECPNLADDDGYWNSNMESNSGADFGISGHEGSRRPTPYSYFDSSQGGRNGSLLFPVAAWQVASRRSSSTGVQKPYKCPHAGCGLRFYHRNNVSRHCTLKHGGAGVRQRNTYSPRMDSSYESSTFHDPSSAIYSDSNITYNDNSSN